MDWWMVLRKFTVKKIKLQKQEREREKKLNSSQSEILALAENNDLPLCACCTEMMIERNENR